MFDTFKPNVTFPVVLIPNGSHICVANKLLRSINVYQTSLLNLFQ